MARSRSPYPTKPLISDADYERDYYERQTRRQSGNLKGRSTTAQRRYQAGYRVGGQTYWQGTPYTTQEQAYETAQKLAASYNRQHGTTKARPVVKVRRVF
jgi:hypothetical protein